MVEWVIFWVAVGCISTAVLLYRGRRRGHTQARETSVVVEPSPCARPDRPWSLVGAVVSSGRIVAAGARLGVRWARVDSGG